MKTLLIYKWWIGAAVLAAILGFFPLMGLPGAFMIANFDRILRLIWNPTFSSTYGDNGWPIALGFSIAFPLVFLAVVLSFFIFTRSIPIPLVALAGVAITLVIFFAIYWFCLVPMSLERGGATQKTRDDEATFSQTPAGIKKQAITDLQVLTRSESGAAQEILRVPYAFTNIINQIQFLKARAAVEPLAYGLNAAQIKALTELSDEIYLRRLEFEVDGHAKDFDSPAWTKIRRLAKAVLDAST